jgi:twitching motility protein PilT
MQTMDQHLQELVDRGLISKQAARTKAQNKANF